MGKSEMERVGHGNGGLDHLGGEGEGKGEGAGEVGDGERDREGGQGPNVVRCGSVYVNYIYAQRRLRNK